MRAARCRARGARGPACAPLQPRTSRTSHLTHLTHSHTFTHTHTLLHTSHTRARRGRRQCVAVPADARAPLAWEPGNNRRVVVARPVGSPAASGEEIDLVLGLLEVRGGARPVVCVVRVCVWGGGRCVGVCAVLRARPAGGARGAGGTRSVVCCACVCVCARVCVCWCGCLCFAVRALLPVVCSLKLPGTRFFARTVITPRSHQRHPVSRTSLSHTPPHTG
jgi:hypothetical protein